MGARVHPVGRLAARADPAVAAGIGAALRRRAEQVGVFVNPTLDEVAHAADGSG